MKNITLPIICFLLSTLLSGNVQGSNGLANGESQLEAAPRFSLKRTRSFSEKRPLDQAMYGAQGNFLKGIFKAAHQEDFRGKGLKKYKMRQAAMARRLKRESARLRGRKLYRGRDTSPEYRAANYAFLLQFQSARRAERGDVCTDQAP